MIKLGLVITVLIFAAAGMSLGDTVQPDTSSLVAKSGAHESVKDTVVTPQPSAIDKTRIIGVVR